MEMLKEIFHRETTKRLLVLIFLGLTFYIARSLFNLILLTFLFTYLIDSMESYIFTKVRKFVKIKKVLITIIIYVLLFTTIVLLLYKYIPMIIYQSKVIANDIKDLSKTMNFQDGLGSYLNLIMQKIDIPSYTQGGVDLLVSSAKNVGKWSFNIFIALILSMFFMLQKDKVKAFMDKFRHSIIGEFYDYAAYFGNSFLNSFGKVIQAQILIALTNSVLSVIALRIMGFPQLLALWAMIFVLSLVPVAGVVISFVPLGLIAYKIGGAREILYVVIMIVILHGIESYILNPKFMSDKTELPVFLTFVILIVSEHFMGVWGLLIGIPLFIFVVELLGIKIAEKK